jgi:hypothetical protein
MFPSINTLETTESVQIETLPLAKAALQLKCGDWAHVKLHAKPPLKPGSKSTYRAVAKGCQASPGTLCNAW